MTFWKKRKEDELFDGKTFESGISGETRSMTREDQNTNPSTPQAAATNTSRLSSEELLVERFGKVRSALGEGTVIQGKLSFDTSVRMDGKLTGEVFSSKALIVGQTGTVEASVDVASLIVMGKVVGSIKASERVELFKGAILEGDVEAPVLVVDEGATLLGQFSIKGVKPKLKAETLANTSASNATTSSSAASANSMSSKPNSSANSTGTASTSGIKPPDKKHVETGKPAPII